MKIPESGVAKVRSGTHRLLLLTSAAVPDDGRRLHNKQLVAGRLSARGIECGAEDLDYELVGGCRDNEHVIKVAARLAPDVGDELKAAAAPEGRAFCFLNYLVADAASSRKVSYQMDHIGGYSFKPPDGLKHLDIEMLPLGERPLEVQRQR